MVVLEAVHQCSASLGTEVKQLAYQFLAIAETASGLQLVLHLFRCPTARSWSNASR